MRSFLKASIALTSLAVMALACSQTPCADEIVGNTDTSGVTVGNPSTDQTSTNVDGTGNVNDLLGGEVSQPERRCPDGATGPDNNPLFAPGLPKERLLDGGGVEFTWLDSNSGKNNEDGYTLERRLPNTPNWALIGNYPPDTSSAIDPVAAESIVYFYRIITYRDGVTAPTKEIRVEFPDVTPPETELLFHPPKLAGTREASFVLRSTEGGGHFTCTHAVGDDEPLKVDCSNQTCIFGDTRCRNIVTNLGEDRLRGGENFFSAAAIDAAGNVDPSPAGYDWEIDITPPLLSFSPTPQAVYGPDHIAAGQLTVGFNSDDDNAQYWCSVATEGIGTTVPWTACDPDEGFSFDFGADGQTRTFSLTATDTLGNSDTKSFTFSIDLQPPVIEFVSPTTTYMQPGPTFTSIVSVRDDGTAALGGRLHASRSAACIWSRNGAAFAAVNNDNCLPASYIKNTTESIDSAPIVPSIAADLNQEGRYTLYLAVTDAVGNTSSKTLSWLHDSTPPALEWVTTPIDYRNPPATLGDATSVFSSFLDYAFEANNQAAAGDPNGEIETVRNFYCRWGVAPLVGPASVCGDENWRVGTFTVADVARNSAPGYTFEVTATDLAGNQSLVLSHNVSVDYPGYTTDVCQAAGSAIVVRSFSPQPRGLKTIFGCNTEGQFDANGDILNDPTLLGAYFDNGGTVNLSYYGVSTTGNANFRLAGSPNVNANQYDELINSIAAPSVCNNNFASTAVGFGDSILLQNTGPETENNCYRWRWEASVRNSASTQSLAKFPIGMGGKNGRHIAVRMRNPQHTWVSAGGTEWQTRMYLQSNFVGSPQPTTLAIHLEVPKLSEAIKEISGGKDRIASRIESWADLQKRFNPNNETYTDLFAETPHCSGMAQIRVQAYSATGSLLAEDVARFAVSGPTVAQDSLEPNAYGSPTGPSSGAYPATDLTLSNLRLEGGAASQQDAYRLGIDTSKTLTLLARDAGPSGNTFYLSLLADGVTAPTLLDGRAISQSDSDGLSEARLTFDPGDLVNPNADYIVMVTAPTVNGCMRYRLEADQY